MKNKNTEFKISKFPKWAAKEFERTNKLMRKHAGISPVPHSPPTPPKKKIKRLQKDYIDRIHAWAWLKGEQFDPDLLGDKINEIIDYINDYQSIYFPLNTHDK